jgi:hypothetical protein
MVTAIQKVSVYGDFNELMEIQGRIQSTYASLFPGSAALTDEEAFALAQVGHMQGLDVFNKEIYYLKQVRKDYQTGQETIKSIGVMPGIRGLRKHAHRQMRYEGGRAANFWLEYQQIMDAEEKAKVGADAHDLVIKAFLRDNVTLGNYLNMRQMIFSNHSSWKDLLKLAGDEGDAVAKVQTAIENTAKEILGNPPIVISYGIVKNAELKKANGQIVRPLVMVNGQNPYYMAEIRAERRALYKRFDLEKRFGAIVDDAELQAEVIDAELEATEDNAPEAVKEEPRTQAQNISQLGFS